MQLQGAYDKWHHCCRGYRRWFWAGNTAGVQTPGCQLP